jgi:hypothetical protein
LSPFDDEECLSPIFLPDFWLVFVALQVFSYMAEVLHIFANFLLCL